MKELRAVNFYFLKYKWLFIPGIFFVITSNYFGLLPPQYIQEGIDILKDNIQLYQLIGHSETQSIFRNYLFGQFILFIALLVIIASLIKGILMFFMRQTLIVMSRKIEYDQKNQIFKQYQTLNTSFYKRNNTGDLMSRISEDVSRVRMYFGPAIMYSINIIALFVMVIYSMVATNAYLSIFVLLPLPILAFLIYKVSSVINTKSEEISTALSNITSLAQEIFSGIRVVKAFSIDKLTQEEFAASSEVYKQKNINLAKIEAYFAPLMLLLVGLSTLMVIYIGGIEVQKGNFTVGNIAEFIYYVNMLTWPVASLGWAVSLVQRAAASQKRINQFLDDKNIIQSAQSPIIKDIIKIEFKNVSFTYPDTGIDALKNINLQIKKGEKIAIVGRTASGKSTLAELLCRTYDVNKGELLINDENIKNINLNKYRALLSYTPQDVFLFSDTIENNILFGNLEADKNKVEHYSKIACVHDDIMHFPKQYSTIIGERGVMLSGGQKQRISIARCLIKDPELIILDDCLSAVDANTERQILDNLEDAFEQKTVVFITHRIFAVMSFDKIIVLDDGQIVEQGTHQTLMDLKGDYYDLYQTQLQENEVKN
ncbi:MAG: ABC transporter ATP-binding protein [Chitinophagales bacterium]